MMQTVQTVVIQNEKETCIMLPITRDEADLSQAFWGKDEDFLDGALIILIIAGKELVLL